MLPFGMTVVILLILICESSFRAYFVCKRLRAKSFEEQCITIKERNRFIALDIVIDLTFSSVPLAILYFGYNLKVPIANVLLLVLFPSLSLILKLNSALEGHIRYRTEEVAAAYESEMSSRFGRKRNSIFGKMWFQQIAETQNRSFPRYMKWFVVLLSVLYVLALNIVLVTQLATVSSIQCHGYIGKSTGPNYYDIGCVLKVPFCQHMLIPRCDCAAVNIVDHNMTALSDKFPRMQGLQTVTIKSGPLRHLPTNMENLAYLTTVDLSFNELQNFTVDVLQWPRLLLLDVSFNAIQTLNAAIWRHPEVNSLLLNSNVGLALPVGTNQINLKETFHFLSMVAVFDPFGLHFILQKLSWVTEESKLLEDLLAPHPHPHFSCIVFLGQAPVKYFLGCCIRTLSWPKFNARDSMGGQRPLASFFTI